MIHSRLTSLQKRIRTSLKRLSKQSQGRLALLPSLSRARGLVWVVVGLVLVWLLALAQSSHAAVTARDLRVKQLQLEALNRENAQLRFEIAQATAPSIIEARALKLGLGPPQHVVYATLPTLQVDAAELMPAMAPQIQETTGQDTLIGEVNVWDELRALFGWARGSDRAEAQGQ